MSANFKANGQYLYNSTASGIVPPVVTPQASDEVEQLLTKLLYVTANGDSAVPSAAAADYAATTVYYLNTTGAGSTPANLTSLSAFNSGTGQMLFAGQALPSQASLVFTASPGTKLNAVAYAASGESLLLSGTRLV